MFAAPLGTYENPIVLDDNEVEMYETKPDHVVIMDEDLDLDQLEEKVPDELLRKILYDYYPMEVQDGDVANLMKFDGKRGRLWNQTVLENVDSSGFKECSGLVRLHFDQVHLSDGLMPWGPWVDELSNDDAAVSRRTEPDLETHGLLVEMTNKARFMDMNTRRRVPEPFTSFPGMKWSIVVRNQPGGAIPIPTSFQLEEDYDMTALRGHFENEDDRMIIVEEDDE